jgi:hypothetical protein
MQRDGAHMMFINVLMNFEQVGFVIQPGTQCLSQWRQYIASNDSHRAMNLGNDTDGFMAVFSAYRWFEHIE